MAIRNIRKEGDEILRKKARPIDVIDEKILNLLKDMAETMYKENGVGLAAPQVGVLRRAVVIDAGDGLIELINPEIVEQSGEQVKIEGCLSIPGVFGEVKRPQTVRVKALNINGEPVDIEGEDMMAVILCHEIDHLDGILYKDKAIRLIDPEELEESEE